MPTDSEHDGSVENPGSQTDPSTLTDSAKTAKILDLERRLSGQTKTVDRLTKKINDLNAQNDGKASDAEEQLSALRVAKADADKKLKDHEATIGLLTQGKTQAEATAAKLLEEKSATKIIAEKYPTLVADALLGDLKLRSDFDTDENFNAYLDRQAKKTPAVEPPPDDKRETTPASGVTTREQEVRQAMRGATPSAALRVSDKKGIRSADEISDDLYQLDINNPDQKAKRAELLAELNKATTA